MEFGKIKNWNVDIEKEITNGWEKSEIFRFGGKTKKIYSIDTPPPYVNAPVHIGQSVTYCYMDFFARYKRMKGFSVVFPLGLDRNGLPIEIGAEKKFGVSPFKVSRGEFLKYCERLLNETSVETMSSFSKLGISFTSYRQGNHIGAVYMTDSPDYRKLTQATFIELYKKGLIYEDTRINNWDSALQTTVADSEIDYLDLESNFNYVKWKVKETGEGIVIGTTRPELICTCSMVIFNPDDKRYGHLEGKTAITPLFGKEVPIKAHSLAQADKGTGLAMMCSAGDLSDIQFFRDMKIKPTIAINADGRMNEHAGFLKGLKVKEARQKIIEELKGKNFLQKQEKIMHRTPISERSKAEIEFIEMPEFYLKQLEFKNDVKKMSKKIKFFPEESRKILIDWIDSVSIDWPISRRRFYATEIPLWHSESSGEKIVAVPPAGKYYQPWKESVPENAEVWKSGKHTGKKSKDFKKLKWTGETRVLDTWMDSSISELFILKYKTDDDFFKKAYPAALRPQGKEIVRTWLYYTILRGYLETKKPCFKDVWINQHILDSQGRKMSKSLGNVVDPQKLLSQYGAEAIRLWAATEGDLSKQDLSCSEEKIRGELKTINKIINVSKFVFLFEKPNSRPKLAELDKLFIDYIEDLTEFSDSCYGSYDFYRPATKLRNFLWDVFASNYIEMIKSRAYNENKKFTREESDSAKYALHFLLERFLTLIYPIVPQLSSVIAKEAKIDLLKSEFPKSNKGKSDLSLMEELMNFNSAVWKEKKEKGISLRNEISGIEIPKKLKKFEKDLTATHNLV
ncbi:valine--tRNA ligase [Candidatus Pacearchaeota archaeon]|nr:valine--tRNA ligase [Candidatus Pacearchaeota archaeon]